MGEKLIVTNRGRLTAKYGAAGRARIYRAVDKLIRADAKRGFTSRLIELDDAQAMKALGAPRVKSARSAAQHKHAIDGVCARLAPDYVLLLGSRDVIPHQPLRNPVTDDEDSGVPSDLPYACDAPYSRDVEDFLGPTRVVGRLPDQQGARDPAQIVRLLGIAARWARRAPSEYRKGFVVGAGVWKGSTRKNAKKLFGTTAIEVSPPDETPWPKASLARRAHLINCHGVNDDPYFYGEFPEDTYSNALWSRGLNGVRDGCVAAFECCYGGHLYDHEAFKTDRGIALSYLDKGAYGVLGSTTIAYGEADDLSAADLLCQHFLRKVQAGASLGRATLAARQEYVKTGGTLDPVDLKTLAQFLLLGDPSAHAARAGRASKPSKKVSSKTAKKKGLRKGAGALSALDAFRAAREGRRRRLDAAGQKLERDTPSCTSAAVDRSLGKMAALLVGVLAKHAMVGIVRTYEMRKRAAKGGSRGPREAFHVVVERARRRRTKQVKKRVLVAREKDGALAEVYEYVPR